MLVLCKDFHFIVSNVHIGCHLESSQAEPERADAEEQLMGTVPEFWHLRSVFVCGNVSDLGHRKTYIRLYKLAALLLKKQYLQMQV